jgi:predicted nucleic acid-binding protein
MNLVDTCGWLEYFADSLNAPNFSEAIEDTENLLVPTIVLYEVFKKITNEFGEDQALLATAHMKLGKVIDMDESVAILGAKISIEKKMPMADALIYASAELHSAIVFTQDDHFAKLPNVKYFLKH